MAVYIARIEKGIRGSLDKVIRHFLKPADLDRGVLIKPNIVFPVTDRGMEITRRAVVEQVVLILRAMKRDADIVIGEGVAAGADARENFRVSGYADLCRDLGVPLVDLETAERTDVEWKYGRISLPSIALTRLYISLPILKLNSAAGISGAMKNQKGLVSAAMKKQFHRMGLHEPLAELNNVIQPHLSIVDCARHFTGPLFLAGLGTAELDSYIVNLLGIAPPENIRLARAGAPPPVVLGDTPFRPRSSYKNLYRPFKRFLRLRIWSGAGACSLCRRRLTEMKSPGLPFRRFGLTTAIKLAALMAGGGDIIVGSEQRQVQGAKRIICFGECAKKALGGECDDCIPGCPPSFENLAFYLGRKGKRPA
ncbi:MAG TPA: DUF362 domain-containing protein [Chitinivibrionales bacterium]|nr:DUF362 domain-containing protein [Chitinivibrionales bacterium]